MKIYNKLKKPCKNCLSIFLILVILFIGSGIYYLFNPFNQPAEAVWFDDNWAYRQSIAVTNNGSAQTNYQLQVVVDTSTLITNSKLQSNCNDLRFTDINGALLSYWIEVGCNTANTLVWVTVNSIPAGSSTVYMYYGNPAAAASSKYSSNPTGINFGTGVDGAITVSSNTLITDTSLISGRSCADGGDAVDYTVTANTASAQNKVTLSSTPSSGCLAANDEILIINQQGTSSNNSNVGQYETARISSISGATLTLNHNLANSYDGTTQKIVVYRVPNYTNVTVNSAIIFSAAGWNNGKGGVIFFRANGTVTVTGSISTNAKGYAGGAGGASAGRKGGINGESYDGTVGQGSDAGSNNASSGGGLAGDDSTSNPANGAVRGGGGGGGAQGSTSTTAGGGGGGGGGYGFGGGGGGSGSGGSGGNGGTGGTGNSTNASGGGGGGSVASNIAGKAGGNAGSAGTSGAGTGGSAGSGTTSGSGGGGGNSASAGSGSGAGGGGNYGSSTLSSSLFLGSGGGGGGSTSSVAGGRDGGIGGGIVYISASTVSATGTIVSSGGNGTDTTVAAGAGGGAAGGSVYINASTATLGTDLVRAKGGSGGATSSRGGAAGTGGDGRIYVTYSTTSGSTSNPTDTTLALPVAGSPASETKGPGPVALWKFDEGFGTTANDSSTNSNTGTLSGTTVPAWQTQDLCISGKCLYFDGSSSYVAAGNGASIKITTALTLGTWIRLTTVNAVHDIIAKRGADASGVTGYAYRLYTDANGKLNMDISSDGTSTNTKTATGATVLTANQWYYVVGVYNPSTSITVYVNGIQDGQNTTSIPSSINNNSSIALELGAENGNGTRTNYLKGFIDEAKIYNYARSSSQVLTDYNGRGNFVSSGASLGANQNNNPNALSNGLVGYWKMDETTAWTNNCLATPVTDSSGNGNNAKSCPNTTGPTGVANGKFGYAGSFDGVDDYLDAGNGSSLQVTSNLTLAGWVNLTTNNAVHNIIAKAAGSGSFGYRLFTDASGKINMEISSTGSNTFAATGATTLSTSTWYHVVGVYVPNTSMTVYVNGTQDGQNTTSIPSSINNPSTNLNLGAGNAGATNLMSGTIDEARIYNRALSSSDVQNLYNFAPRPIGYWNFEDGSGSTLHDISTNANNGTWTGTPTYVGGKVGSAGSFDGSTQYITVTDPASGILDFGTSSFSYEFWFYEKAAVGAFDQPIHKGGSNASTAGFDAELGTGAWIAHVVDGTTSKAAQYSATEIVGSWTHLAAVVDRTSNLFIVYKNGVQQASTDITGLGSVSNATKNLGIGAQAADGSNKVNGRIDEIRIYNYARSNQQVVEDMNAEHPSGGSPVGTQVGYWKFDEGFGTTANNSSISNNSGTLTNMSSPATSTSGWTESGKFNKALLFDGTNDYVTLTTDVTALKITGALTLSAWINLTNTSSQHDIICKWTGTASSSSYCMFVDTSGKLNFEYSSGGTPSNTTVTGNTTLSTSTWYHVVAIFNPSDNVYLYINGVQDKKTSTSATSLTNSTTVVNIGAENAGGSNFMNGTIDEVKVYAGALSPAQILVDYNQGAAEVLGALSDNSSYQKQAANQEYCIPGDSSTCTAPAGEWKFEEGSGTTANDTSINAKTATITAGTGGYIPGKIGFGYNFDKSTTKVQTSSTFAQPNPVTIEAWIYPKSMGQSSTGAIFAFGTGTTNIRFTGTNGLEFNQAFSTTNGRWTIPNNSITLNAWNQVTMVYNGTSTSNKPSFSINGQIMTVTTATTPSGTETTTAAAWVIGNNSGQTNTFDGIIDQVRVFDYARSVAQAAWDYNHGGPVGWWKFDECQGSTANDSSGSGNSGTITIGSLGTQTNTTNMGTCTTSGTTPWFNGATGKINASINLDGTDDYVAMGSDVSTFKITKDLTLSAWIKATSLASAQAIIAKFTTTASTSSYRISTNATGNLTFGITDGVTNTTTTSNQTLSTSTWYHVVGVYNSGTSVTLYINGVQDTQNTTSIPSSLNDSTTILDIGGQNAGSNSFSGQIDDARVYNYALTATQVKTLYSNGVATFAPSTGKP